MRNSKKKKSINVMPSNDTLWFKDDLAGFEDVSNVVYDISQIFIQARVSAGLTQYELAKRMGTTQSVIERLESGKYQPTLETLNLFAKATGTLLVKNLRN